MINQDKLKELLDYNPDTGVFYWKTIPPRSKILKIGRIAGCLDVHGYIQINVNRSVQKAHRLAWLYMTGDFPNGQIDHLNHDRADNRWVNLRVVDNLGNHRNRPMQSNNSSGIVGVCFVSRLNKWRAYLTINGKQKSLGYFNNIEEAKQARINANNEFGFYKNHGIGAGRKKYKKYVKKPDLQDRASKGRLAGRTSRTDKV